ncbi:DUF3558 domain-containing protein [Saccharomonospora piscinae]|uniref:DUF3558 domain-containing protein n=1 Tax=Saccharomonospora piscinae TaxID=687388 RepID=A0A1V9A103_SACPI|nr:DUF3558 family protein [Saccharomonospora piscinae]OQO90819.1 DUF3558 domain-containing protein [Saccharomonospora piscinae]TLW93494.1 DUF3558 domain-containing protein [Saccharomonospora piscinae]
MRGRVLAVLATALLAAGCATTVAGVPTAQPRPSAPAGPTGEPCALLTAEQASALKLAPEGEFTAGDPGRLMPALCVWTPANPDLGLDPLTVNFSVDIALAEYFAGAEPEWEKEIGGLRWARYLDPVGGEGLCNLATELSPSSFVTIVSGDFVEDEGACEQAEAAAPFVASHLPGGEPAPEIRPEPPSPLESVDPCSLLEAEQAEELDRRARGEFSEGDTTLPPRCVWVGADGDERDTTIVGVAAERAVPEPQSEPTTVSEGGRQWRLYRTDLPTLCRADLAVTETSYVSITVTQSDVDPDEVCGRVEDAIPFVTANLPGE